MDENNTNSGTTASNGSPHSYEAPTEAELSQTNTAPGDIETPDHKPASPEDISHSDDLPSQNEDTTSGSSEPSQNEELAPVKDSAPDSHQEVFGGQVEESPNNNYYTNTNVNYNSQPEEYSKGFAIASLIMGILSILTCCCIITGIIFGILGIVFYCVQPKDSEGKRPAMATVGLILSIIGIIFSIAFISISIISGYAV